jgi:hypothetical protein
MTEEVRESIYDELLVRTFLLRTCSSDGKFQVDAHSSLHFLLKKLKKLGAAREGGGLLAMSLGDSAVSLRGSFSRCDKFFVHCRTDSESECSSDSDSVHVQIQHRLNSRCAKLRFVSIFLVW